MKKDGHVHQIAHQPLSGSGYAVCDCGATAMIDRGQVVSGWHSCRLCTHGYGLPSKAAKGDLR